MSLPRSWPSGASSWRICRCSRRHSGFSRWAARCLRVFLAALCSTRRSLCARACSRARPASWSCIHIHPTNKDNSQVLSGNFCLWFQHSVQLIVNIVHLHGVRDCERCGKRQVDKFRAAQTSFHRADPKVAAFRKVGKSLITILPSGKRLQQNIEKHNCSHNVSMGKSTISMAIFNSKLLTLTRENGRLAL